MQANCLDLPLVIADLTTIHLLGQTVEVFSGILAEVSLPWTGFAFFHVD